jgi:hypothetical protein
MPIDGDDFLITADSTFDAQIQPTAEGNVRAAVATVDGTVNMSGMGQTMEMRLLADIVFIDLKQYFRLQVDAPAEADLNIPDDWFVMDLTELEGVETGMAVDFELLAQASGNRFMTDLYIPANEDTIKTIEENPSETIDGQEYRVFTVTINPEGTIPEELSGFLDTAELEAQIEMAEGSTDEDTALIAQLDEMMDAVVIREQIWIDVESGLPHHIILNADYSGLFAVMGEIDPELGGIDGSMRKFSDVTIEDINAPFTAEVPKDAVPIPATSLMEE